VFFTEKNGFSRYKALQFASSILNSSGYYSKLFLKFRKKHDSYLHSMKSTLPLIFAFLLSSIVSFAQNAAKSAIDAFAAKTGAVSTIDKATNSLSFLRFPRGGALNMAGNTTSDKALNFVKQNQGLFSAKWENDSYLFKETRKDNYGLEHVTIQQFFQGVPVYEGTMKFHFNLANEITSLNGNFILVDKLNTVASVSEEEAARIAIKIVTSQQPDPLPAPLKVYKSNLSVFQKGLVQGYKGPLHLVYEIEVRNAAGVREFLFIDAHTKLLVEQFTGTHAIDRKLYETSVSDANLKWQESDGTGGAVFSGLDQWQKSEVESSAHIYNLMKNTFGYTSYNGANASMITINNNPSISCPNANWNGTTANYCTGTATDDVVAHEWGHAYTEHTSGLIYAWQAGAMNEAYSDIWGETVDQINGYMDAGESNADPDAIALNAGELEKKPLLLMVQSETCGIQPVTAIPVKFPIPNIGAHLQTLAVCTQIRAF